MKKIINSIILLIIICFSINYFANNKQIDEKSEQLILQDQGKNVKVEKLGFWGNFFANILLKIAESDKGQDLLLRMIKPVNTENTQTSFVNNRFYLDTIFNIKSLNIVNSTNKCYCGSDVLVSYKIFQSQNLLVQEDEVILHLGQADMPVLENTIVGMRQGEIRTAWIPYIYANNLQKYMLLNDQKRLGLKLEVMLHKIITPEISDVKIFDDRVSTNRALLCGEKFTGNINITSFNGKVMFSKQLNYQLGDKNYPLIFSYAGFNKSLDMPRYVITKGQYLRKMTREHFFDFKIVDNELFLIEFN